MIPNHVVLEKKPSALRELKSRDQRIGVDALIVGVNLACARLEEIAMRIVEVIAESGDGPPCELLSESDVVSEHALIHPLGNGVGDVERSIQILREHCLAIEHAHAEARLEPKL